MKKNGNIEIIDRKSSVVKLANGVFVSQSFLEQVFKKCGILENLYIHASPNMMSVGAVVIPDVDQIKLIFDSEEVCFKFLLTSIICCLFYFIFVILYRAVCDPSLPVDLPSLPILKGGLYRTFFD